MGRDNYDLRYYRRPEVDYRLQPAQLLAKLQQVDGAGSGLDADELDGQQLSEILATVALARHMQPMTVATATTIPAGYCLALDHVEIESAGSLEIEGVLNL